jgi:hypothetical protein
MCRSVPPVFRKDRFLNVRKCVFAQQLLQWKTKELYICCVFCSARYSACNAHVPHYIVICGLSSCIVFFSPLSHKCYDFRKRKLFNIKCVLISAASFIGNICHSKNNWASYDQNYITVFMWSNCYFIRILVKLEISRQLFEKYVNIKFHTNPSSGSTVVPCTDRWTDGHDETNILPAFRNVVQVANNETWLRLQTHISL